MDIVFWIVGAIVLVSLMILKDWLIYKQRGNVIPDPSDEENPPIITGPEDAHAQRLIDLYKEHSSDR